MTFCFVVSSIAALVLPSLSMGSRILFASAYSVTVQRCRLPSDVQMDKTIIYESASAQSSRLPSKCVLEVRNSLNKVSPGGRVWGRDAFRSTFSVAHVRSFGLGLLCRVLTAVLVPLLDGP